MIGGGGEVPLFALEDNPHAAKVGGGFAVVELTPEQLAKHAAYRAKKKQTKYHQKNEDKEDKGLSLTRSVSPPFTPPAGPIGKSSKPKQKKTLLASAGLSAKDKKLLHNRAAEFKQTKVPKVKEEQLQLQATLQLKLKQQALLLQPLHTAQAQAVAQTAHAAAVEAEGFDSELLPQMMEA